MSNYYAIRGGEPGDIYVGGPYLTWQDACLAAYGVIDNRFEVKNLGSNAYWVQKKAWVRDQINDRDGWFKPYIREMNVTLDSTKAMGPVEIGQAMTEIVNRIKNAETITLMDEVQKEASEYLRFLPLNLCQKFNDVCQTSRKVLEIKLTMAMEASCYGPKP